MNKNKDTIINEELPSISEEFLTTLIERIQTGKERLKKEIEKSKHMVKILSADITDATHPLIVEEKEDEEKQLQQKKDMLRDIVNNEKTANYLLEELKENDKVQKALDGLLTILKYNGSHFR